MSSDDGSPAILAAYWTPFTIAILAFGARTVSRMKFVRYVGIDDLVMVLSMVTATVSSILMTIAVKEGLGQHIWKLRPDQSLNAVKYSWIAQAFAIFTFAFGKISIALFLLLLVVGAARLLWHRFYLHFVMFSVLLVNTVVLVLIFTQCRPVQKLFDPNSPGQCWNPQITTIYAKIAGAWSAMTDVSLVLFAIWIVGNLQMGWLVKVRLCCLLGLGIFAAGCAIAKTYYLSEHDHEAFNDLTYGQTNLSISTALEQYVIIIGANVPCVQSLVVAFSQKVKTMYSHHRTTRYPLEDTSVYRSHSLVGSSNAILGNHSGGGNEENRHVSGHSAKTDHPAFLESTQGILKTVDMDVHYGSSSTRLDNASRMR